MIEKLANFKVWVIVIIVLVISNLVILNLWMVSSNRLLQNSQNSQNKVAVTQSSQTNLKNSSVCPNECLTKIMEATASTGFVQPIISKAATPTPSIQPTSVKEIIIPVGYGTNQTSDWSDIPGSEVYIDSTKYSKIKNVVFEATFTTPDGNQSAYVRLFDVTDKHPVWFSDLSIDGGGVFHKISQAISLDSGNKLYRVQMKTSLQHLAVLYQAIVRITLY